MDIRTYPHDADSDVDAEQMTHFDAIAELNAYAAENERLRNELDLRIRQLMETSRVAGQLLTANEELRAELRQCVSENNQLTENAAELGKALDMALAERDEAFAALDALRAELLGVTNARDFLRASLHTERSAHNATAAQLHAELAGAQDTATAAVQAWRTVTNERDALRAELDAMRQAHSVIVGRMAAMGC